MENCLRLAFAAPVSQYTGSGERSPSLSQEEEDDLSPYYHHMIYERSREGVRRMAVLFSKKKTYYMIISINHLPVRKLIKMKVYISKKL